MSIDQRRANLTRLRARAEEEGWSDGELDDLIRQEANLVKEELGLASSEPSIMRHAHLQRHFSEFRTNQGLESLIDQKISVKGAKAPEELKVDLIFTENGEDKANIKFDILSSMSGLALKSDVISELKLTGKDGGFQDFILECGGAPFHSRAAIATNPHLLEGKPLCIRRRYVDEPKRTGMT